MGTVLAHTAGGKNRPSERVIMYSVHVCRVQILNGEDKKKQILQVSAGYCVNLVVGVGGRKAAKPSSCQGTKGAL